jgi:error-prone DNA polymerase
LTAAPGGRYKGGVSPLYAELHCHSYYSFLDGTSAPEDLAARAAAVGLPALALTDHDGVYGVVAFSKAARQLGVHPVIGAEMTLATNPTIKDPAAGSHVTLLAKNGLGYANLCRLISYARQRQPKGKSLLDAGLLAEHAAGLICLSGCSLGPAPRLLRQGRADEAARSLAEMASWFAPGDFLVELQRQMGRDDSSLSHALAALADGLGLPVVATGNVHYATADLSRLQDVLVCIRNLVPLSEAGRLLRPNSEACLRPLAEVAALFADRPDAIENAAATAARCQVELDFSAVGVPPYPLPDGESGDTYLRRLCEEALPRRYRSDDVAPRRQMEHELAIIAQTGLSEYFLTVYDIVAFAKQEGIRCQGRGSAANSIVSYILGISAVDPLAQHLLFERFLSVERYSVDRAMPDIDLDFERDRREEVIQYVYNRYGWENTAMVCTLVSFRARSAIRDVGKALGFAPEALDRVAKSIDFRRAGHVTAESLAGILGESANTSRWQMLFELCRQIDGLPRHLGIHVGGMVITRCPLIETVPVEPATMPGRVVVQWDKDSVEDAGLIKIDLLSLAMLSAVSESLTLMEQTEGQRVEVERLTLDDPVVYDLICAGDTIGVFQVESRAQAQMLPRLRPRCFNDLVIEVALIRPGPIQGGMVNPYLRRRRGEAPVEYEHPGMATALADTLGIVVFQEQVLLVAREVAGFTLGEAEMLRRAMGRKRSREEMEKLRQRFVDGATANGATVAQAHHVYDQLAAFSGFGFNRAHAASFALITYASAWLKHYHPLPFLTAILNNQPMGFYSPSVVVEDIKRRGVKLLPVDVNRSGGRCSIEAGAIRLGLNYVHGFGPDLRERVVAARGAGFADLADFCRRVSIGRDAMESLILAGGCDCWGEPRRQLLWGLARLLPHDEAQPQTLADDLPQVSLPALTAGEAMVMEYAFTGVSSKASPAALYRRALTEARAMPSLHLRDAAHGAWVRVGGQVIVRQRPPTAKGFTFITLQDEWGVMNLVLHPDLYPRYRLDVRAPAMLADGIVERDGGVINVRVRRLWPLSPELDQEGETGPHRRADIRAYF